MKKFLISQTAYCMILVAAFLPTDSFAQWSGSSTINNNIYRNGNVGIGQSAPTTYLHVRTEDLSVVGGGFFTPPNIRLEH